MTTIRSSFGIAEHQGAVVAVAAQEAVLPAGGGAGLPGAVDMRRFMAAAPPRRTGRGSSSSSTVAPVSRSWWVPGSCTVTGSRPWLRRKSRSPRRTASTRSGRPVEHRAGARVGRRPGRAESRSASRLGERGDVPGAALAQDGGQSVEFAALVGGDLRRAVSSALSISSDHRVPAEAVALDASPPRPAATTRAACGCRTARAGAASMPPGRTRSSSSATPVRKPQTRVPPPRT